MNLDKIYFILFENLQLDKIISFYLKKFFICKTGLNKIQKLYNWEQYLWKYDLISLRAGLFSAQIFLFRNSFLWSVKKKEFVLTEQRRIFNTSKRRSYWRPELPSVSLLEVYWKKSLLKQWRAERLLKILFFIQF